MSKQNVETVRRWIDAYNRRDFECLIGLNDPDFEFRSFVSIESVFRGTEAFPYAYFKTLDEATPSFQVATCAYFPMGTSRKVSLCRSARALKAGLSWHPAFRAMHVVRPAA